MCTHEPLVSVIVPVYNLEKVVARCLDSIKGQTYKAFEVIVIDDGSTDQSLAICQKYADTDSRFTVYSQKNGGVSSARNFGIDVCNGEIIVFVDSDDFVLSDYLENIVKTFAANEADIVVTRFASGDESGTDYHVSEEVNISGNYGSVEFEKLIYTCKNWYEHSMVISVLGKGYKRRIFDNVRFEGRFSEDYAFTDVVNSQDYRISVIDNIGYIYCYSPNSLTHKTSYLERIVFLDVLEKRLGLFSDDEFIVNSTCKLYCNMYIEYYYKVDVSERDQLKKYKKKFDSCISILKSNRVNDKKFFLRMNVFRTSPYLYGIITSMKS